MLAASLAHSGFVSLFPLLLVLVTILGLAASRFVAPGSRAGRDVTAGALSVIRQVRRRQEYRGQGFVASVTGSAAPPADGIGPRGVCHAGR